MNLVIKGKEIELSEKEYELFYNKGCSHYTDGCSRCPFYLQENERDIYNSEEYHCLVLPPEKEERDKMGMNCNEDTEKCVSDIFRSIEKERVIETVLSGENNDN